MWYLLREDNDNEFSFEEKTNQWIQKNRTFNIKYIYLSFSII